MPRFGPGDISNHQALDVVLYVTKYIKTPANIGGIGLGGVGPVAEGFVGLFIGVGVCLLAAYWVGDRTSPDQDEHEHEGDAHGDDGEGSSALDHAGDEHEASATDDAEAEDA
jgi:hypothetical protein